MKLWVIRVNFETKMLLTLKMYYGGH